MPPDPSRPSGAGTRRIFGVAAAAVCCGGLPLLLGAGIALSATGILAGSALLIAAGVVLALWAWHRRQTARACESPKPTNDHLARGLW